MLQDSSSRLSYLTCCVCSIQPYTIFCWFSSFYWNVKKIERDIVVSFSTPTYHFRVTVIILKLFLAGCVCLSWWSVCREQGISISINNEVFQLPFGFIEIELLCEVFMLFNYLQRFWRCCRAQCYAVICSKVLMSIEKFWFLVIDLEMHAYNCNDWSSDHPNTFERGKIVSNDSSWETWKLYTYVVDGWEYSVQNGKCESLVNLLLRHAALSARPGSTSLPFSLSASSENYSLFSIACNIIWIMNS